MKSLTNLLLLDIDGTILPELGTDPENFDDALTILELNCKYLAKLCLHYQVEIQIISSWCTDTIWMENGHIAYDEYKLTLDKRYYEFEYNAFRIIKNHLDPYIKSLSCGNKRKDIKLARQNKTVGNIIVFEDSDYSDTVNPNDRSFYIKSEGYFTPHIRAKMQEIYNY